MSKPRRHPRTLHSAEILCPIDCGMPRDDCRCLTAMLHDRELTAFPTLTIPPDATATACAYCGAHQRSLHSADCQAPECRARRAQGALEAQAPLTRASDRPTSDSRVSNLWRAVVRAFAGGRG